MIETHDRVISGQVYKITQHGAKEGRKVLARLVQILGKPVAALADGEGLNALVNAVGAFVAGLTPAEVDYFCDTFAPKTVVQMDGAPVNLHGVFDLHFAGQYGDMLDWLVACIEVNYASFFVALRARVQTRMLAAMVMMKGAPSASPTGATGESIVSPSPENTAAA